MKTIFVTLFLMLAMLLPNVASAVAGDVPFFSIYPRFDKNIWYLSDGWANGDHQSCEWRATALSGKEHRLHLELSDHGGKIRPIGCAEIQSNKRFSYGRYEARMKTAAGSGLNTAFFTYIGPPNGVKEHDEIDFEFLGKDSHTVQVSYWRNAVNHDMKVVDLGFDAAAGFHDYMFEWHPDKIIWYADGKEVHRTTGEFPTPINPSKVFFSLWSGSQIEDDWLGAFKYDGIKTADVEWFKFTPFKN